jgi:hypothetical protein
LIKNELLAYYLPQGEVLTGSSLKQQSMLDLLQTIGVLLKLFAFGVLAVTSVVVVYALLQMGLQKSDPLAQGHQYRA